MTIVNYCVISLQRIAVFHIIYICCSKLWRHISGYVAKPAQATLTPSERGYGPPTGAGVDLNNTEPLYVDTNAEAIPLVFILFFLVICNEEIMHINIYGNVKKEDPVRLLNCKNKWVCIMCVN